MGKVLRTFGIGKTSDIDFTDAGEVSLPDTETPGDPVEECVDDETEEPVTITVPWFCVKVRKATSVFNYEIKEFRDPRFEGDEDGVLTISVAKGRRALDRHRFGPGYWLEAWWEERTEEG